MSKRDGMVIGSGGQGFGFRSAAGFTLVEMLVTMVIALIILGGLLLTFQSQYGHYKFQQKQVDAEQDMEAVMQLLADDLQGVLIVAGTPAITIAPDPYASPAAATIDVYAEVWESDAGLWGAVDPYTLNYRAMRHYRYDAVGKSLKYDRNTRDGSDSPSEVLQDVTWFQVWQGDPYSGLLDAPAADPYSMQVYNNKKFGEGAGLVSLPLYTALIEMEVPVGYKGGRKQDVFGNATNLPRLHRYIQLSPRTALTN